MQVFSKYKYNVKTYVHNKSTNFNVSAMYLKPLYMGSKKNSMEVNGYRQLSVPNILQNIFFCFHRRKKHKDSYRFRKTWGWVNDLWVNFPFNTFIQQGCIKLC